MEESLVRRHVARDAMLSVLASDEPVAARLLQARPRLEQDDGRKDLKAHMTCAVLAALAGMRQEAESCLAQVRGSAAAELRGSLELTWVLLMLEAGHPVRATVHLERARLAPRFSEDPADAAISQVFHAQALLLENSVPAARSVAAAGADAVPPDLTGTPLAVYSCIVAAEAALAGGDVAQAELYLARIRGALGRTGVLAARADELQARVDFTRHGDPKSACAILDLAISRLSVIGAPRDLGLAFLIRAALAAADPAYSPASWLARAQPLLAQAGAPRDLQLLRRAFRSFGRRVIDRVDADVATAMDRLREQRARLEDVLSAQRVAVEGDAVSPEPGMHAAQSAVDQMLAAVRDAEEQLIAALEHSLVDRERIGQLVAVSQEIASIEGLDELIATIPRLALVFCPANAAELLEVEPDGSLTLLSRSGAALETPRSRIEQAARATLSAGATRVEDGGRGLHRAPDAGAMLPSPVARLAVIPLRQGGRNLVLVVERAAPGAQLTERDLEQLTVYGSLAGTSLARSRSNAAVREAAARDAATMAAIRDGVLALDREGVVRSINQAAARVLGIRREDALGRRLRDIPGLAPLGLALAAEPTQIGEVVMLPRGDVVIRAQAYEGGVVATFRDFATAQKMAQKIVESAARFTLEDLVGSDQAFLEALELARRAAQSDVPILITGESGTGKEMLAQAIHNASSRASAPFVGINVAAIPRELLESELFGYDGGAFTGARSSGHAGKFELAGRGTLLLDEIGDMPLEMQGKLLRVLQERMVQRLGGTRDIPLRARVIATSHRDLEEAVGAGRFRLDLFHRLRVAHLRLPPLRQRRGDVPLLVEHHLRKYAERMRRKPIGMAPAVIAALEAYDWPGNVRELANLVEGEASLLLPGQGLIVRVPASIERARSLAGTIDMSQTDSTGEILRLAEVERRACEQALLRFGGNVAGAARALGVSKGTLYNKIKHYQIRSRLG